VRYFVLRRFAFSVLLVFVSSLVIFFGMRAAPGDVTSQLVNPANSYSTYLIPNIKKLLGLDKPLLDQYLSFVGNTLSGHPGVSLINGDPITRIIASAGKYSLILGGTAFLLTLVVGIPLGMLAARFSNSVFDNGATLFAALGMGIPNFFLAVLLISLFAIRLKWLPAAGASSFRFLILPAIVLALPSIAIMQRLVRSSMLEQLSREYVRALRARGIPERRVVAVHAFRNALPPILALTGTLARDLLAYTMIVEVIFRWPGLGYQLVQSILERDYTLAQVLALMLAVLVIVFNLLADVGQRYADPRVREAGAT
jgi:ABC-type dipeptide/oligopeptide/nickel transport system permease component